MPDEPTTGPAAVAAAMMTTMESLAPMFEAVDARRSMMLKAGWNSDVADEVCGQIIIAIIQNNAR